MALVALPTASATHPCPPGMAPVTGGGTELYKTTPHTSTYLVRILKSVYGVQIAFLHTPTLVLQARFPAPRAVHQVLHAVQRALQRQRLPALVLGLRTAYGASAVDSQSVRYVITASGPLNKRLPALVSNLRTAAFASWRVYRNQSRTKAMQV